MAFEYLKKSNIAADGTERYVAYENYDIDERGIWYGRSYLLVNNHKNNSYAIYHTNHNHSYFKEVQKGKEETLTVQEFKKWLIDRDVEDGYMEWLRNNPEWCEEHPNACGVEYVRGEQQ